MIILLLLVPLSVMLLAVAIGAFIWAVRNGQFEELDSPAIDIFCEQATPTGPAEKTDAD